MESRAISEFTKCVHPRTRFALYSLFVKALVAVSWEPWRPSIASLVALVVALTAVCRFRSRDRTCLLALELTPFTRRLVSAFTDLPEKPSTLTSYSSHAVPALSVVRIRRSDSCSSKFFHGTWKTVSEEASPVVIPSITVVLAYPRIFRVTVFADVSGPWSIAAQVAAVFHWLVT